MAKWANEYPISRMSRILHVTKSAYYDWKQRGATVVDADEFALCARMKALFAESRESLGSRGMVRHLRQEGRVIGRYRARRHMKRLGLVVKTKRKYRITTQSKHNLPVAGNVLNREFNQTAPNQAWVADITYVWTVRGFCYVAFVIDAFSRMIVGWRVSPSLRTDLCLDALEMAVWARGGDLSGLVHHSDRGVQYCSIRYSERLADAGIAASVGSRGDSYDNALAETVNGLFKAELIHRRVRWRTVEEVELATADWVAFWNFRRLHSATGYLPPAEYERAYLRRQAEPIAAA